MKDSINPGQNINLEEIVVKCILFVGIGVGEEFLNWYLPHFFHTFFEQS